MRSLLCWALDHRWFNTVIERRVVLEYSMRADWIYDVRWQARTAGSSAWGFGPS